MQEDFLISPTSSENKDNTYKKENIRGWVIQILFWLSIVGTTLFLALLQNFAFVPFYYLFYIIHVINAGYCSINTYVRNKEDNATLSSKLNEYFSAYPIITSKVKNYHYQETKKIITSEDVTQYPYYSSRDISGLFNLNCSNKSYVMLEIRKEIYFADPLSYSDYINGKNALWLKNNGRDQQMGYFEDRTFGNYKQYHLLRIDGNSNNSFLNCGFYWALHLFGLGQIYNAYVNSICIRKVFTIRKVISTRHNLLLSNEAMKYDKFIPNIHLTYNTFPSDKRNIVTIKEEYPVLPFSQEQIDEANRYYGRFVPKYTSTHVMNENSEIVNDLYGFSDQYNGEVNNDVICNVMQSGTTTQL